jgi:hypothetical protein
MKKIILVIFLLSSITTFAQNQCELRKIPPVGEIKCVGEKAYLYDIFPKISSYKGFLFQEVAYCNYAHLDVNKPQLRFDYCISEIQKMTVTITDLEHPFYKTNIGKPQKDAIVMMFQPEMINPYLQNYQSNNKNFDLSYIHIPNVTNGQPYVTFEALQSKRFWVHIVIEAQKLNTPILVDDFITDYTKGFMFLKN